MNFWNKYKKTILMGGGALLAVIIILIVVFLLYKNQSENNLIPADNTPIAQDFAHTVIREQSGAESGYKINIVMDDNEINPYPGTRLSGKVQILNSDGSLVSSLDGWANIFIGETNSFGERKAGTILAGTELVPWYEYNSGLSKLEPIAWEQHTDGSNVYEVKEWALCRSCTPGIPPALGNVTIDEYEESLRESRARYLLIKKGEAEFEYINRGTESGQVIITVLADEEPIYPPAENEYTFRPGIDPVTKKFAMVSDEPESILEARLSNILGYQVIGLPKHYGSADIYQTIGIPIGDFKDYPMPKPELEYLVETDLDYFYEVEFSPSSTSNIAGEELMLTVKPKALPGKTLPFTIYDKVTVRIEKVYADVDRTLEREYPLGFIKYEGLPLETFQTVGRYSSAPQSYKGASRHSSKQIGYDAVIFETQGQPITVTAEQLGISSIFDFLAIRTTSEDLSDIAKAGQLGQYSVYIKKTESVSIISIK